MSTRTPKHSNTIKHNHDSMIHAKRLAKTVQMHTSVAVTLTKELAILGIQAGENVIVTVVNNENGRARVIMIQKMEE